MDTLSIYEGILAIAVDQQQLDGTNIIPVVRGMVAKVLAIDPNVGLHDQRPDYIVDTVLDLALRP